MTAVSPHIVLIMVDQLRRDTISGYGNVPVKTPQLINERNKV
jgi:hypothetical protein